MSAWPGRFRRLPPPLLAGGAILAASLVLALFPGAFAPYDPDAFDYDALLAGPSWAHPFGADNFGRDMLSRVIHAYTVDLQIALFATVVPFLVGTAIGAAAGYAGGTVLAVFGRVVDAVVTFPFLVLVIAVVAVLGPGLVNMYVAVATVGWVFYARLVAAEVAVQKSLDYAAAARGLGFGTARLVFRHLLPNAITPAITYWMTDMALAILLGSSLGYLGLGAQPPTAEWGTLIADGKNFLGTAPWVSLFPGVAIVVTGLAFSLLGDGLAALLEVRR